VFFLFVSCNSFANATIIPERLATFSWFFYVDYSLYCVSHQWYTITLHVLFWAKPQQECQIRQGENPIANTRGEWLQFILIVSSYCSRYSKL